MTSTSLTLRRQKFVSEYVETGNATQAARLAGYSPRTAYSQGSRLLTFVEVQQAIETERQTLRARVELDQDQLVGELLSLYREARNHRHERCRESWSLKTPQIASAMRPSAIAQYSADVSYPTYRRPAVAAAIAVAPVPINGSRTTSLVYV